MFLGAVEISTSALKDYWYSFLKFRSVAGITGYQYFNGQITETEALVDATFGAIGFIGQIGAGISILYFGGKFAYE